MNLTAEIFNWAPTSPATRFGVEYTDQERAVLTQSYEETLNATKEYEVVKGAVVAISNRDVIINIGLKSDGLVSLNEFRDLPDLKPGDEVEVYIERQEDAKGQLVLSRKKAKLVRGWEAIQAAADNNEVLEGLVKRRTKGGLIVDIYSIEAFLPGSQIDVKPVRDFDAYIGKSIDVAVVKINHANDNVVVSHKALIEKSLESQKVAIIGRLEKGQILEGIIKNMTSFGVFIDLGGVDGLLHITDISWGRIGHPEEVLELGQKVKVVVTDFNEDKKRISLGMKQLTPHPWQALPVTIEIAHSWN
jgi:small subunit ribosomal protein S1